MELSPRAKKMWEEVPPQIRVLLLNNVYCVTCRTSTGIGQVKGTIEKGVLILRGICTRCGGAVVRVID